MYKWALAVAYVQVGFDGLEPPPFLVAFLDSCHILVLVRDDALPLPPPVPPLPVMLLLHRLLVPLALALPLLLLMPPHLLQQLGVPDCC